MANVAIPAPEPKPQADGNRRRSRSAYIFLLPWILGVLLLTVVPMATSLYLSFTRYFLGTAPQFIGLANYQRMLADPAFVRTSWVTVRYVFLSVPLQLVFALAIAVVLNRGLRGLALYRSIYYLPSLLGGSVAVAVLWRQLFASNGVIPEIAGYFGITMGLCDVDWFDTISKVARVGWAGGDG